MKDLNIDFKERKDFFKKIGTQVALEMSKGLQNLTAEKLNVGFSNIRTFEQDTLFVDVREKCFCLYANFRSPSQGKCSPSYREGDTLQGIIAAIFPLSSTKTLIELLLKRYLGRLERETIDSGMKLSAFKEAANIMILTYITGIANALKVKLEIGKAKFVCFRNVEFIKPSLLKSHSNLDCFLSVGQLRITGGVTNFHLLKGAILFFLSSLPKENERLAK